MGKSALFAIIMFAAVLALTAPSRGDVATAQTTPSGDAAPEPITGTPAVSSPGDESVQKDPFSLYDIGPPGTKTWSYNDLSPEDQAWADRNANRTGWDQISSAYAHAVNERSQQAAADAAAHQLGVTDNLNGTGVVQ